MSASPALLRAMLAQLLDHFHVDPEKIGRLTDRQILDLYYHKRNKDGSIKWPEGQTPPGVTASGPATLADELAALDKLARMLNFQPGAIEAARAKLHEKFSAEAEKER